MNRKNIAYVFLMLVCVLSIARKIFVNVHIDEEIIVSMGYRVIQGDRFFLQIQEPQLLIAPLIALIELPFIMVTGGTVGIFVYMKCIMVALLIAASFYTYFVFSKFIESRCALFAALICFFFHYRYINVVDYTFLYNISILVCILSLFEYKENRSIKSIILSTITFCAAVVSFPTIILIFPIYLLLFWDKTNKKEIVLISLSCFAFGMMESYILFSGNKLTNMAEMIGNMISGSTYMKKNIDYSSKLIQGLLCLAIMPVFNYQKELLEKLELKIRQTPVLTGGGRKLDSYYACWELEN